MTYENEFFKDRLMKLLKEKESVIDIGSGLKIKGGNRHWSHREWLLPYLKDYKTLDYTDEFKPDIVGDIHALPFADNSIEAILCLDILEHIEDPKKAASEMYRVLKPGGYILVKTPFLFYFHAHNNYYKDYWRFTHQALELLFKYFSVCEISPIYGKIGTITNLIPFMNHSAHPIKKVWEFIDKKLGKTNQVAGHYCFLIK